MEKDQSKEENESRKEYLKLENLGNMVREKVFGWNERKSERESDVHVHVLQQSGKTASGDVCCNT
jgi:hypothetical protein